jgi:YbgC/YbaW family acyl-CoA thioester hydrolase
MSTLFRTTRRIEFADTDMAGIVHFANFFRYMEAAETEFLRSLGLSVRTRWNGQEIGFPRVSVACDYQRPARFEDVLDIALRIEKIGTKSVTYGFEFSRAGELLATGRVTAACCTVLPDRGLVSIAIPDGFRTLLEQAGQ